MQPVLATQRVAARARLALVAGAGGVVEIAAARALQQIAADGGGIAKLGRGARQQGLRHRRIGSGELWIMSEVSIAHQRADAQAAIGQPLNAVELRQARDVDDPLGAGDAALHQVKEVGAGGEIG